jgi:hypothetical protein
LHRPISDFHTETLSYPSVRSTLAVALELGSPLALVPQLVDSWTKLPRGLK